MRKNKKLERRSDAIRSTLYVAEVSAHHIPLGGVSLFAAMAIELAGAAALLSGRAVVPALLALVVYTVVVNFFYFDFWDLGGGAAIGARKEFLKNLAVAGGILAYLHFYLRTRPVDGKS